MKIIIGLGNPEKQYANTRHNVGFFFMDKLREKYALPDFSFNKNFNAETTKGKIAETEVILVKPQTFMNLSGEAVQAIANFYKVTPDDLLVIHDDLDIALGKFKIATDSSSAGHNGVQNIIEKIGIQKFRRVRVGIGQSADDASTCRLGAHDFVLGKFSAEETDILSALSKEVVTEIEKMLAL
jgi:peptidyl-tRNA hydrolase, PTH1 family